MSVELQLVPVQLATQERPVLNEDKPARAFAVGASKCESSTGIYYDNRPDDYVNHLRSKGQKMFSITHRNVSCHEITLITKV